MRNDNRRQSFDRIQHCIQMRDCPFVTKNVDLWSQKRKIFIWRFFLPWEWIEHKEKERVHLKTNKLRKPERITFRIPWNWNLAYRTQFKSPKLVLNWHSPSINFINNFNADFQFSKRKFGWRIYAVNDWKGRKVKLSILSHRKCLQLTHWNSHGQHR